MARASAVLGAPPVDAVPVWPAAGVAIASILLYGHRTVPGLALAGFAFYAETWLRTSDATALLESLGLTLLLTTGPLAQALLAAALVRYFVGVNNPLVKDLAIVKLLLFAGPIGCLVAATFNIGVLFAAGVLAPGELAVSWITWWAGDSIGAMLVTPLLLLWLGPGGRAAPERRVYVGLPLSVMLAGVCLGFGYARADDREQLRMSFERQVGVLHAAIGAGVDEVHGTVQALRSHIEASGVVERRSFERFAGDLLQRQSDLHALEWIPRVPAHARAAFEAALGQGIMASDSRGELRPAAVQAEYYPVEYVVPLRGNETALGFDVSSNPQARDAQQRAIAGAAAAATAPIRLVQEAAFQSGFVMYRPVYRHDQPREGTTVDADAVLGLVAVVIRMSDFIEPRLRDSAPGARLTELQIVDTGAADRIAYSSIALPDAQVLYQDYRLHVSRPLTVAGREWRIDYYPTQHFITAQASWASWVVLAGGVMLCALLGAWLLSVTGRTVQVAEAVEERTMQLSALEKQLLRVNKAVEFSPNMVLITDPRGDIEYVNPKFAEFSGYPAAAVLGRNIRMLQASREGELDYDDVWTALAEQPEWHGELRSLRRDGSDYWAEVHIAPIHAEHGAVVNYVTVQHDVTADRTLTDQISYQASHDQLTGLINRAEFERRLNGLLELARNEASEHALCFLDLDQFKIINDTSGHIAGDELLRQLGALLHERIRISDTLARLGGDEFGILMAHCSPTNAVRAAEDIRKVIEQFRFIWDEHVYNIGVSIGVVAVHAQSRSITEVLKNADSACYAAKDAGRNRIHVYAEDDTALARRRGEFHWVAELGAALDEDRFELYGQLIQPIQDASARPGVELLVRLRGRDGKSVPPGAFLPAAERYNLSTRIDAWVVDHALGWLRDTPRARAELDYCSINLSGPSLGERDILERIHASLADTGLPASMLMFEITETSAIANLLDARKFIGSLQALGCRFALDDFGSGLSSFGYLKHLGIDCLKIDGMFIKDVADDAIDAAIVRSINEVGHVMGMTTVAEFVENAAVLACVRDIGVDRAQGYGIARPVPLAALFEQIETATRAVRQS